MFSIRAFIWGLFFGSLFCIFSARAETNTYTVPIQVDGLNRFAFIHVPPNLDPASPPPLVVMFHGGLRDAASAELGMQMDALADQEKFMVLYPNGEPRPGQLAHRTDQLFWNSSQSLFTSDTDDDKFVGLLLDKVQTLYPYNPKAVFATGFSNGAQMAYHVACNMADRFTAIASVSGSLETEPCQPSRPVPILDFHGTADPLVPFNGHGFLHFQSTPWTLDQWVQMNGCNAQPSEQDLPTVVNDGTSVKVFTYAECQDNAQVVSVVIANGGHAWPGLVLTPPYLYGQKIDDPLVWKTEAHYLGLNSQNINADSFMWNFFKAYR